MIDDISESAWQSLVDEVEPATYGELISALADRLEVSTDEATAAIDQAIDEGSLVEADSDSAFPTWIVPADSEDDTDDNGDNADLETRAYQAFGDAIDWFHAQLDRELPAACAGEVDTAREYFEERGWKLDTIDAKQLGYAPASRTGLLDHLMGKGYDRETILGTGLFYEDLTPHFQGRYVFPYFDSKGKPVYAISRSADHPHDPKADQKYTKAIKTTDYSLVEEPIYGQSTIEDGRPLIITEGMADAITAHQAGYPCISPVTKQFKTAHHPLLLDLIEDHEIPRVYILQDAEQASVSTKEHDGVPATISDALHIEQHGEGLRGAIDTAAYLADNDIEARLGEFPRPGTAKVDLDDYLQEWSDTLAPVLKSAKPVHDHSAYDPQTHAIETARTQFERETTARDSDGTHSALFDLDIRDATGLDADYRGPNPLGHHGDSESYFVIIADREIAFDHKYKAAYNALTYLLCAAGERRADAPNGRLDDDEILAAWLHAKQERLIPDDDPIPHRALVAIATENDLCDRDAIEDGWKLPQEAYDDAIEIVEEEHGVNPGRAPLAGHNESTETETQVCEWSTDPTTLDVVVDPEKAWRAVSFTTPDNMEEGARSLNLPIHDNGDGWECPECGEPVDVVRAVAIDREIVDSCAATLTDAEYTEAYRLAKGYGAPLPDYVDAETATDNWELVQGAVQQLTHWHLGEMESTVTGEGTGDAVAILDPSWADSASGQRIVAFRSGQFYCRKHERLIDPLRFVALEAGIISRCDEPLEGEKFTDAYHITREEYGAPLPEWQTDAPAHIPVLPPAEELLGEFTTEQSKLDRAREEVTDLFRECIHETDTANVLTTLPALGKTTAGVILADEYPLLYTAPRKELQREVFEKAQKWGRTAMHLPVFAEERPNQAAVAQGLEFIREEGKQLLREAETLVEQIDAPVQSTGTEESEEGDTIDLDRASCPVANGEHGPAWQLAVHLARALGHSPKEIHTRDTALFGDELPCQCGDAECSYGLGWEEATDPDAPYDILIGHYEHAHVDGARIHRSRDSDERITTTPRTIAIDEFPGDAFDRDFGPECVDHATWLAKALHPDIDDRQDLFANQSELADDDLIRAWIDGTATQVNDEFGQTSSRLTLMGELLEMLETVEECQAEIQKHDEGELGSLPDALCAVTDLAPEWNSSDIADAISALQECLRADDKPGPWKLYHTIDDDVLPVLQSAARMLGEGGSLQTTATPDRVGGAFRELIDGAVDAFCNQRDGAWGVLHAAQVALEGGTDGCRELAVHADDGYAHPLANLLLHGLLAADGDERISTASFDFTEECDGTNLTQATLDRFTVLLDRNHQGAIVRVPPPFQGNTANSVIGLDATGREWLWELAIGCSVEAQDIHKTAREKRAFLQNVLNLQVIQTSPHAQTYSGPAKNKNFDGDVALVDRVAEEYSSGLLRQDKLAQSTAPGVITTKSAEEEIAPRIQEYTETIEHYGDITGSNALASHNIGIVLGSRHYGDAPVEKWAAMAGEEVTRSGRGMSLDYGCTTGNTFLKHMREDETLQAILRFGRDEEGAVVFAHTAALAESLPVVGEGAVVRAFSENNQQIMEAAAKRQGESFTVNDVAETVDCTKRQVRRVLNEHSEMGYLSKHETKNGLANEFEYRDDPGVGEVDLPSIDEPFTPDGTAEGDGHPPDESPTSIVYTWNVRVDADPDSQAIRRGQSGTILPAPTQGDPGLQAD